MNNDNDDNELMRLVEKEGILRTNEIKDPKVWKRHNIEQNKNRWINVTLQGQIVNATR